jgi:hypothetical protein
LDRDLIGDDDWEKERWQEHMQEMCREAMELLGFSGTRDFYSGLNLKGATNCKGTENMVLN